MTRLTKQAKLPFPLPDEPLTMSEAAKVLGLPNQDGCAVRHWLQRGRGHEDRQRFLIRGKPLRITPQGLVAFVAHWNRDRLPIRTAIPLLRELFHEAERRQLSTGDIAAHLECNYETVRANRMGLVEPRFEWVEAFADFLNADLTISWRDR